MNRVLPSCVLGIFSVRLTAPLAACVLLLTLACDGGTEATRETTPAPPSTPPITSTIEAPAQPPDVTPVPEPTTEPTSTMPAPTQPRPTAGPQTQAPPTQAPLAESPPPASRPGPPVSLNVRAMNLSFDLQSISVPANSQVTVNFVNADTGVAHDFGVSIPFVPHTETCFGPCTDSITFNSGAGGTYTFQCSVHAKMVGIFTVE